MQGGDLASIWDNAEYIAIQELYTLHTDTPAYLGLNDIDSEGVLVWSDSSTSAYMPAWSRNKSDENHDCVGLTSPVLDSYSCFENFAFFCGVCSDEKQLLLSNNCFPVVSNSTPHLTNKV